MENDLSSGNMVGMIPSSVAGSSLDTSDVRPSGSGIGLGHRNAFVSPLGKFRAAVPESTVRGTMYSDPMISSSMVTTSSSASIYAHTSTTPSTSMPPHMVTPSKELLETQRRLSIGSEMSPSTMGPPDPKRSKTGGRAPSKDALSRQIEHHSALTDASLDRKVREWTVEDDILLLASAVQIKDMRYISVHARFSKPHSVDDMNERFYEMMFNEAFSKVVKKRFAQVPCQKLEQIQRKVPFTIDEKNALIEESKDRPLSTIEDMDEILRKRGGEFYHMRTPQLLLDYFNLLKRSGDVPMGRPVVLKLRNSLVELDSMNPSDSGSISQDDTRLNRSAAVLATRVAGVPRDAPQPGVYAVLRGANAEYKITQDDTLIGRASFGSPFKGIDLSLEGPARSIAHKAALLSRNSINNEFMIKNTASRPIIVDGKTISEHATIILTSGATIEIALIKLVFKSL